MELKDVIHFYLGCTGLYSMADEPDPIESKLDFDLLNRLSQDPDETCFQPYLRPLSDMTEEENKYFDEHWSETFEDIIEASAQTVWLISRGFDLFNLISSGQAIDKTKQ